MHLSIHTLILLYFFGFFTLFFGCIYTIYTAIMLVCSTDFYPSDKLVKSNPMNCTGCKTILLWTYLYKDPISSLVEGQQAFIKRKCSYNNCYVTTDEYLLNTDYTKFDVIVFNAKHLQRFTSNLPVLRSPHQKFVLASVESGDYYPICEKVFNDFFNWTWTFKANSDLKFRYMIIRDNKNKIIDPNKGMNWMKLEDMDPVTDKLKTELNKKSKAAAWFVSNCKSKSKREDYVKLLQAELAKYNLTVDIYGECYKLKCNKSDFGVCNKMIKDLYYFFLAFENSFQEDYVTKKILIPLMNNAVPIVYGGANYTRFVADSMYLNARKLGVTKLAAKISYLIQHPAEYYNYFRWKNHYKYNYTHVAPDTDNFCAFCEHLNNEKLVKKKTVYSNIIEWWTPPGGCDVDGEK